MKKRLELIFVLLIQILILGISFPARAEKISGDLLLRLEQVKDDDYYSCLLVPKDQNNIDLLKYRLSKEKPDSIYRSLYLKYS